MRKMINKIAKLVVMVVDLKVSVDGKFWGKAIMAKTVIKAAEGDKIRRYVRAT